MASAEGQCERLFGVDGDGASTVVKQVGGDGAEAQAADAVGLGEAQFPLECVVFGVGAEI